MPSAVRSQKWTWGYVVGRDFFYSDSKDTCFQQIKENGKLGKILGYHEAKELQQKLGEPYYIKRLKWHKNCS